MRSGSRIRSLLIAIGTALVLAWLVTELKVRVFPDDHFALFLVAFVALCSAWLLGRTVGRSDAIDHDEPGSPGNSPNHTPDNSDSGQ